MRLITGIILIITWIIIVSTQALATENIEKWVAKDYVIGPGDSLHISVWKNEDLTRLLTVLPDGKVSFPLIGDVIAGGKTVFPPEWMSLRRSSRLSRNMTRITAVRAMRSRMN